MTDKNPRPRNFPVGISSLVQATDSATSNLASGYQYGIFTSPSYISCAAGPPIDYETTLLANTSTAFSLEPDYLYYMYGKLLCGNEASPPVIQYIPESLIRVCKAKYFIGDPTNKTVVQSFGNVALMERESAQTDGNVENNLIVTMNHVDWDLQARGLKRFQVKYRIPGRRNLINAQTLFEVGREFILYGNIVDWDHARHMPLVEVISLTWTNPPSQVRAAVTPTPSPNNSPSRAGRRIFRFGQGPSSSHPDTNPNHAGHGDNPERIAGPSTNPTALVANPVGASQDSTAEPAIPPANPVDSSSEPNHDSPSNPAASGLSDLKRAARPGSVAAGKRRKE